MSADDDRAEGLPILIGLGASAGGVEALTQLVRELPATMRAAIFVVLHVSPAGTSVLGQILDRAGPLPAAAAADGTAVAPGRIYVAPPDRHLLVEDGIIRLSAGPRENGHRPAIDPTFRALAAYGRRSVGVVLSGNRDDGTQGLARIKAAGGTTLVQAPEQAAYDGMVRSAMTHVEVDGVLPVAEIAARLAHLSDPTLATTDDPQTTDSHMPDVDQSSTRYTCPECGGHLSRQANGEVLRYVCEVGHAYAPASLDDEQALAVESALWTATRLLGDRRALLQELAGRADQRGQAHTARGFRTQAAEAERASDAVRALLESGRLPTAGVQEDVA